MNVRLLRRIAKVIQEKPKRFDMTRFDGYSECGTTHCIGGWATELTGKLAVDALDITGEQSIRLFYVTTPSGVGEGYGWPKRFRGRKKKGMSQNQSEWRPTAKQAAARIEHFIKTKGAE